MFGCSCTEDVVLCVLVLAGGVGVDTPPLSILWPEAPGSGWPMYLRAPHHVLGQTCLSPGEGSLSSKLHKSDACVRVIGEQMLFEEQIHRCMRWRCGLMALPSLVSLLGDGWRCLAGLG